MIVGNKGDVVQNFISEDDLETFDGWLRYQGIDASTTAPEELETWRGIFDDARARSSASLKVGLMKLRAMPPGERRYAVAVREGTDLWLTLWVRRSPAGEFFVLVPRRDRDWDIHASYHLDGRLHMKSHGRMDLPPIRCQPLTGTFRGTQPLVAFAGYGPKSVGAICDPTAFSGLVEVPPGILGPRNGQIAVDLVEPGCQPADVPWVRVDKQVVFRDIVPWVVVTVGSCR
jgi:hypothetical protein